MPTNGADVRVKLHNLVDTNPCLPRRADRLLSGLPHQSSLHSNVPVTEYLFNIAHFPGSSEVFSHPRSVQRSSTLTASCALLPRPQLRRVSDPGVAHSATRPFAIRMLPWWLHHR